MTGIEEFLQGFVASEHDEYVANLTERDPVVYEAVRAPLGALYAPGMLAHAVGRSPYTSDRWFENGMRIAPTLRPRTVFRVRHHRHPELGELYRCDCGSRDTPLNSVARRYAEALFAVHHGPSFRFVAVYRAHIEGLDYPPRPLLPMEEGSPVAWGHVDGLVLDELGQLVATQRLAEPTEPAHLVAHLLG